MASSHALTLGRLEAVERLRRPVYKIFLAHLEGWFGHTFYRRAPPRGSATKQLLHLGCGDHHFPGWVNADYYRFSDLLRKSRGLPDWMLDAGRPWHCPTGHWDGIYTEHTLEHLNYSAVVNALREAQRTLKPGGSLRIVLPGLNELMHSGIYRYKAEGVAHLTQTHGHVSVWDAELMTDTLREVGFSTVRQVAFGQGRQADVIKDLPDRAKESFYVEAEK